MATPLRVQLSPLSRKIYVGHINKTGDAWSGEPQDVTSDAIGAVVNYFGVGNTAIVYENGTPRYEVTVTEIIPAATPAA